MKILAVYGSNYGQAHLVLDRITAALMARGHAVTMLKGDALPADLAVEDYGAAVVAASVRMGKFQHYMVEFAKRFGAALSGRPAAFVSVHGTRPETSPEWQEDSRTLLHDFAEQTGWRPRHTASFAGKLQYSAYDFLTRFIMKGISKKQGGPVDTSLDYEYTDWDAVDRFAKEFADSLETGAEAAPA